MNQDQVKEILLRLDGGAEDFSLIFSGKTSKKVNGLYHPEKREIIIHNRNFQSDGALLYTAVHEFAHHLHFTRSAVPVGPRSHTREFRRILHGLLARAEELALISNPYEEHRDLAELTREIRENLLKIQGENAARLGEAFIAARELCQKYDLRFDDYVERVLQFDQATARAVMTVPFVEAPPELGYENLKLIAAERDPEKQIRLKEGLVRGESRDLAKSEASRQAEENGDAPRDRLLKEKHRLERTIRTLEEKLKALDERLASL